MKTDVAELEAIFDRLTAENKTFEARKLGDIIDRLTDGRQLTKADEVFLEAHT